jgi:MinD-like ATPase involved in chromosome partitioning or flagellar assembly
MVAAQLAWAAAHMGRRVLLVDADLAAPSQHLLLGSGPPQGGLAAFMGRENRADSAPCETRHPNLRLLSGGRNPLRPEAVNPVTRLRLYQRLRAMDAELTIIDVGAGLGYDAPALLELGDQRIIVATAQPASVDEAFALLKAVVDRTVRRYLTRAGQLGLLEPAVRTREGERLSEVLHRVQAVDPALCAAIHANLDRFGAFLFGNQFPDGAEVGLLQSTVKMAFDYLAVPLQVLGCMRADARLPELGTFDPAAFDDSDEGRVFRKVVTDLLEAPAAASASLEADLEAAVPDHRPNPPPLPIEAVAKALAGKGRSSPAPPGEAPSKPAAAARKKPLIYVRPARRRRADATVDQKPGRRTPPLPGMPPRRPN